MSAFENTALVMVTVLAIGCSSKSSEQNMFDDASADISIKGLWTRAIDSAKPGSYYMEILDNETVNYTYRDNPQLLISFCYEVDSHLLQRVSGSGYIRDAQRGESEFVVSGDELTITHVDWYDENYNCKYDDVDILKFTRVDNISTVDFYQCNTLRKKYGLPELDSKEGSEHSIQTESDLGMDLDILQRPICE